MHACMHACMLPWRNARSYVHHPSPCVPPLARCTACPGRGQGALVARETFAQPDALRLSGMARSLPKTSVMFCRNTWSGRTKLPATFCSAARPRRCGAARPYSPYLRAPEQAASLPDCREVSRSCHHRLLPPCSPRNAGVTHTCQVHTCTAHAGAMTAAAQSQTRRAPDGVGRAGDVGDDAVAALHLLRALGPHDRVAHAQLPAWVERQVLRQQLRAAARVHTHHRVYVRRRQPAHMRDKPAFRRACSGAPSHSPIL